MSETIADILASERVSFSFEVFPPKKQEGFARMEETVAELCGLGPSFMSVTCGASGSRDTHTVDVRRSHGATEPWRWRTRPV